MKIISNSIIYTAVSVLQRALGFFLLPVYTLYLTADDYGVANVVTSVVQLLSILLLLSLQGAGTRFEYKYGSDPAKMREIWGTLLLFVTANALVMSAALYLFRDRLLSPFLGGIPFHPCMLLGLVAVALRPTYALFQANLQARQLGKRFGLNNLLYFFLNAGLTVLFVAGFGLKAEGILLALALTNGAFFLYTLVDFVPRIDLRFRAAHLREAFRYSLPLVPHSVAGWAMSLVDRLFLNHYQDAGSVGVYSIGYQIGNLINILTTSINQAFVPWFFEKFEQGEAGKARIARVSEAMVMGYALCALMVSLFAEEVLSFMVTAEFRPGWKVVPLIAFAFVYSGVYYVFVNPLFVRRTALVPVVTLSSAALGVALNLALIPRHGMLGAAASSFLSMLASSLIALLLSRRYERIDFRWARILAGSSAAFLASLVVFLGDWFTPIQFFAIKAAVLAGGGGIFGFLYREEAAEVRKFLASRKRKKG